MTSSAAETATTARDISGPKIFGSYTYYNMLASSYKLKKKLVMTSPSPPPSSVRIFAPKISLIKFHQGSAGAAIHHFRVFIAYIIYPVHVQIIIYYFILFDGAHVTHSDCPRPSPNRRLLTRQRIPACNVLIIYMLFLFNYNL